MTGTYDAIYFQKITEEEKPQAQRLAKIIKDHFNPETVIDIGCGNGLYVKELQQIGIVSVGVDYALKDLPDEDKLGKQLYQGDITSDEVIQVQADLALCLEVLEHIEESKAEKAIKYICESAPIVLFSAAQVGQGGEGHINCQPKIYWEEMFRKHGYYRSPEDELKVLHEVLQGYHMGWLANNLMIFVNKEDDDDCRCYDE